MLKNNLKKAREIAGLTQQQLGDAVGVTASAIGHYEIGSKTPKVEVLMLIAKRLNITLNDLVGD